MTEAEKAELRALLKPGSREPTDAEYEVLRAFRSEFLRRWQASSPPPMAPGDVRQAILKRAAALGCEPHDPAVHGELEIRRIG